MTDGGPNSADKTLGEIVSDVSEKASLLVREEIELAKAEIQAKVKSLGRGAGIGAAAGIFLVFALVMLLHTVAWLLVDAFDMPIWAGFAMVTLLLVLLALIAGLVAARMLSRGTPPTPDMAIEQAKITRQALESQAVQRDQLERSLEGERKKEEESGKP
jgi:uncharacterized membrane protein YqjE